VAKTLLALWLLSWVVACTQEQRYVVEQGTVEMTSETPPTYVLEDDEELFLVDERFEFPISRPPADHDFNRGIDDPAPFPRGPWVYEDDVAYELDWVLENRSKRVVEAALVVDGISEFYEYQPGPEDLHQIEKLQYIPAGGSIEGTLRELELSEVAIDLATVVNGAPNSNQVVFELNNSRTDARTGMFVPDIVPGLVGVRIGILTHRADDIVLTFSVRATDLGDRIPRRGEGRWELPTPMDFIPVVPPEE